MDNPCNSTGSTVLYTHSSSNLQGATHVHARRACTWTWRRLGAVTGTHQGAACTSTRVLSCAGANPHTKGSFRGNLVLRLTHTKVVIVHVHVRYPPPPALLVPPHHSANVPPCNVRIQPSGTQLIVGDSRLMPQGPASPPFRDEAPHTNGLTPLASAAPVPRGAHTLLGVGGLLMLLVWQHQHKLRPVMLPVVVRVVVCDVGVLELQVEEVDVGGGGEQGPCVPRADLQL